MQGTNSVKIKMFRPEVELSLHCFSPTYHISRNFGEKTIWLFKHQLHLTRIKFDEILCSRATPSHLLCTIPMTPSLLCSAAGRTSITVLPKRNVARAHTSRFAHNGASPIKRAWYPFFKSIHPTLLNTHE